MLRHLDLFSGIGGFALGLQWAGGFETVAFCECDKYCQRVLRRHWPDVPIYKDVETIDYDGSVDIITGGFPCQGISNAGYAHGVRKGFKDKRSGLYKSMFDVVKKHKPKYAIFENVAALWPNELGVILKDLNKIGYDAEWHIFPASRIGCPQRRERVWIVAYASGQRGKRLLKSKHISKFRQRWPCRQEDLQQVFEDPLQRTKSWPQPLFCGSNQWIPHRVDRLRGLGNAVVPQIPMIIGQAITHQEDHI